MADVRASVREQRDDRDPQPAPADGHLTSASAQPSDLGPAPGLAVAAPDRPLGPIQRALLVGHADDPYEREAEATADRVLAALTGHAAAAEAGCADHAHPAPVQRISRVSTAAGAAGGELEPGLEAAITRERSSGGSPIPTPVRRRFEDAFGADFGGVRLHTGQRAAELSEGIGAKAFTLGSDIFLGAGQHDLTSTAGLRLLGHELTHTVQQGGATTAQRVRRAPERIQRDVGFELETRQMASAKAAAPITANFTDGVAATTAFLAGTPLAKGTALLKRGRIEVQADEADGASDVEIVIDHVPETASGRQDLDSGLDALATLLQQFDAVSHGGVAPASAVAGTAGFTLVTPEAMMRALVPSAAPSAHGAITSPQVTMGLRLENVGTIVEDLHGSALPSHNDGSADDTSRRPGKLRMRAPDAQDATKPRDLAPNEEAQTLVTAHTMAKAAVAAHHNNDPAAPVGAALEGFLTIVFAYAESIRFKGGNFMKSHTPLMAKTDLATMWKTLPPTTQTYFAQVDQHGVSKFEELVKTQARYDDALLDGPLFGTQTLYEQSLITKSGQQPPATEWYHKLTMRDWLRSIVVNPKPGIVRAVWEATFGKKQDRRVDKLTNKAFPGRPKTDQGYLPRGNEVEGYGALGSKMDTDATDGTTQLPIFELRSASRQVPFSAVKPWVMDMYDYVVSVNAHPATGGTKIT